jgi:hypothetical protein
VVIRSIVHHKRASICSSGTKDLIS